MYHILEDQLPTLWSPSWKRTFSFAPLLPTRFPVPAICPPTWLYPINKLWPVVSCVYVGETPPPFTNKADLAAAFETGCPLEVASMPHAPWEGQRRPQRHILQPTQRNVWWGGDECEGRGGWVRPRCPLPLRLPLSSPLPPTPLELDAVGSVGEQVAGLNPATLLPNGHLHLEPHRGQKWWGMQGSGLVEFSQRNDQDLRGPNLRQGPRAPVHPDWMSESGLSASSYP